MKAELSKKNRYWISKHRYYELKHLCLQYKELIAARDSIAMLGVSTFQNEPKSNDISKPVEDIIDKLEIYNKRIKMIENAAKALDEVIGVYILKAVTNGLSYEYLKTNYMIPYCKDSYYNAYRLYFWTLDKLRE